MANPLSCRPAAWIVAAFAAMAVAITVLLGEAVTLAARRRRKPGPSRRQTRRRAGEGCHRIPVIRQIGATPH
jgi:hypothetical protein